MTDVQYPCGKCGREVSEDPAIQCEGECEKWYHTQCVKITDEQYDSLKQSESTWECSACNELPAFNTVDAVDVFNFDFMQNLATPKLTVGQQF